jgi:hypothetical protein
MTFPFMQPMRRAGGAKSEADFKAYLATLTAASIAWGSSTGGLLAIGATQSFIVNSTGAAAGYMEGSSWATYWCEFAPIDRVVQHAFPSQAAFDAFIASGGRVLVEIENIGTGPTSWSSVDRNGYQSASSSGSGYRSLRCNRMIFWHQGQAWENVPRTGGSAQPHAW